MSVYGQIDFIHLFKLPTYIISQKRNNTNYNTLLRGKIVTNEFSFLLPMNSAGARY